MKKENILVLVLVALAVVGLSHCMDKDTQKGTSSSLNGTASISEDGIEWKDYSEGMALAQEQGKPIFLYFYADW